MRGRPILFSAPMIRALLDGSKTQTRRIVKPQPMMRDGEPSWPADAKRPRGRGFEDCPYGAPGDRLWCRETWQYYDWTDEGEPCIRFAADNATEWPRAPGDEALVDTWEILSRPENYNIDNHARDRRWRPSIHMPKWASRITLDIESVRVERLQDISEADVAAEGVPCYVCDGPMDGTSENDCHCFHMKATASDYRNLWESINGAGSWDANPWVWVVEFKRVKP